MFSCVRFFLLLNELGFNGLDGQQKVVDERPLCGINAQHGFHQVDKLRFEIGEINWQCYVAARCCQSDRVPALKNRVER